MTTLGPARRTVIAWEQFRKQVDWDTLRLPYAKKLLPRVDRHPWSDDPRGWSAIPDSSRNPPAGQQVDNNDNERYYQQDVDEATCDVHAETKQPQDQEDYNDCPKHIRLHLGLQPTPGVSLLRTGQTSAAVERRSVGYLCSLASAALARALPCFTAARNDDATAGAATLPLRMVRWWIILP